MSAVANCSVVRASAVLRPLGPLRHPLRANRSAPRPAQASANGMAAALPQLGGGVHWAVDVMRHTLTLPQVLQHLEQLERIEAAGHRRGGGGIGTNAQRQHAISWVEHSTSAAASLMDGVLSESEDSSEEDMLAALGALPPHLLTDAQKAALVMQAWQSAAHTKPEHFDADAQLTLPGLADVAVVSRGGWQRHGWKSCNQDTFLALPLAAGSAACQDCVNAAACCSSAVAIGVFDGHGRAGQAASAHLRNALASGLLMHNQLALLARSACQQQPGGGDGRSARASGHNHNQQQPQNTVAPALAPNTSPAAATAAQEEAVQLLERCFAAAASTMPSTGADFSLSGSTAVLCLVQPGSVTAAWAGDSRAVLGLHKGERYIACALTHDHRPSSPLERARIEQSGGWVMQTMLDEQGHPSGPHRVYLRETNIPGLAVSRCFGDYVATGAGVTSTPDVTTLVLPLPSSGASGCGPVPVRQAAAEAQPRGRRSSRRRTKGKQAAAVGTPHMAAAPAAARQHQHQQQPRRRRQSRRPDAAATAVSQALTAVASPAPSATAGSLGQHILIVASDGLWEFVSSAEAVRIASRCISARAAAEMLTQEAQAQWAVKFGGTHCDDITCAVAFLPCNGYAMPAAAGTTAAVAC